MHIDQRAEQLDQAHMLGRHRRQRKNMRAGGQSRIDRPRNTSRPYLIDERKPGMARIDFQFRDDSPVQRRLPALIGLRVRDGGRVRMFRQGAHLAALGPCFKPVLAIGGVIPDQRGEPERKLVAHQVIRALQIRQQARVPRYELLITQRAVDAPGERFRLERRGLPYAFDETRDLAP